ncbi:uncharacterized protein PV06_11773 [Exophiala oligosperma]|uniref:ABC transporter domain-containing protein n=1 Tax=Exophiala oligosperma TaxID=215243 RepID=A0A0D2A6B9_9EURO|nr:uncharacterized protein PV06_11773 [Exophiala oligosperma]KIW35901.1 hypothetical protein PV06_11773 [Exophiala oligosperma]
MQESSASSARTEEQHTAEKGPNDQADGLMRNKSAFTWKNLCYTVNTPTGERQLLDNEHGWIKPGKSGALMGSSGAGKAR